ncbi:hypothetical protein AWV79_15180 [Cupriavidus sp. UYMMa02A]|nr:hypothetical protein AWV80_03265 [Cupriavidus sp. UYMU48A]ODV43628.1 hypothetical protein AWV79_15180 [Cupriavidus sp. UYMMa02A]
MAAAGTSGKALPRSWLRCRDAIVLLALGSYGQRWPFTRTGVLRRGRFRRRAFDDTGLKRRGEVPLQA